MTTQQLEQFFTLTRKEEAELSLLTFFEANEFGNWDTYLSGAMAMYDWLASQSEPSNKNPLKETERNWAEDFPDENGNYINDCKICGNEFIGHKYRRICRLCSGTEPSVPVDDDAFQFELERRSKLLKSKLRTLGNRNLVDSIVLSLIPKP